MKLLLESTCRARPYWQMTMGLFRPLSCCPMPTILIPCSGCHANLFQVPFAAFIIGNIAARRLDLQTIFLLLAFERVA